MATSDNDKAGLIERAVAGDSAVLKLLLIQSHSRVSRHVARRLPTDLQGVLAVEDIVQETHIEVFQRIRSFEPRGPGAFDAWVTAIAVSRLSNAIERQSAAKRGGRRPDRVRQRFAGSTIALLDLVAGPGGTPSRSVARHEAVDAVHAALDEIPKQYRQAMWLVYIEGLPAKEAAAEMGRSERALHGLCRRGLVALRDRLHSATDLLSWAG